jgi:hypothetical protein
MLGWRLKPFVVDVRSSLATAASTMSPVWRF